MVPRMVAHGRAHSPVLGGSHLVTPAVISAPSTDNTDNTDDNYEDKADSSDLVDDATALHDALITSAQSEGLRERKKRLMRQLISDTATEMFLLRGFDEVRVSEIAAACEVSEKTIYNYFPTKESLFFDREEDMAEQLRRALGPGATHSSPVDAAVALVTAEVQDLLAVWDEPVGLAQGFALMQRFHALVSETPSLRNARAEMFGRLVQVAAEAMAARAGVNPEDPEPQIAADALLGLWNIQWRALRRLSADATTPQQALDAVVDEVRRGARLIDSGLSSFDMSVFSGSGQQQVRAAAAASNDARKQVVAAIKQARDAWRQVVVDAQEAHGQQHAAWERRGRGGGPAQRGGGPGQRGRQPGQR